MPDKHVVASKIYGIFDRFMDLHLGCGNIGRQLVKADSELDALRRKLTRLEEDFRELVEVLAKDGGE